MSAALEHFVKQLQDSELVSTAALEPCRAISADTEQLTQQLVVRRHLTEFQAEQLLQGNASSLVLGNYILLEKIGAGGMGQVFKARHRRMDRIVAIKLLPEPRMTHRAWTARFEREVRAGRQAEPSEYRRRL